MNFRKKTHRVRATGDTVQFPLGSATRRMTCPVTQGRGEVAVWD